MLVNNGFPGVMASFYIQKRGNYFYMENIERIGSYTIIRSEVSGEVKIKTDTQMHRVNATKITVEEGIKANLYGIVKEMLILKRNCVVNFYGTILGQVVNEGGSLHYNILTSTRHV
jgi:hypothetical protein